MKFMLFRIGGVAVTAARVKTLVTAGIVKTWAAVALVAIVAPSATIAAEPADPLRFFPTEHIPMVVKIDHPRKLIESVLKNPAAVQAQELRIVQELLDSADARRFFQLLAYYERDLGVKWPEMIDTLAGGGIAFAVDIRAGEKAPFLGVIQGTDSAKVEQFFETVVGVVRDQRERDGVKGKIERAEYMGAVGIKLDNDLFMGRSGSAILVSNKTEALKKAVETAATNAKGSLAHSPRMKEPATLLPKDPLMWFWVDMRKIKESQQAKDLFATPRNDVAQTVLFAGLLNAAARSDFIAGGLFQEGAGFRFTVRMPAGRNGMAADAELHVPRDTAVGGSLPLLHPPGTLFSHSFYLDLNIVTAKTREIFPEKVAMDFREGEKQLSRFLIGTSLPKLFAQSGVYHRIVIMQPEVVSAYKTVPEQRLPSGAFVTTMRDPVAFAKSANSIIKGAAVAVGSQASLRFWEEEHQGVKMFGYSFPDNGKFPDDPTNLRFNYQPSFAVVGEQLIAATNKGVCKTLIETLATEKRSLQSPNMQMRFDAAGFKQLTDLTPDQTLATTILSQGLPVAEARKHAEALVKYIESLGSARIETDYGPDRFRFDAVWTPKK